MKNKEEETIYENILLINKDDRFIKQIRSCLNVM